MFFLIIFINIMQCCWSLTNDTNTTDSILPTSPYAVDCSLHLVDTTFRDRLSVLLDSGDKMIEYEIKVKDYYQAVLERKAGSIYRWNHWVRTINNRGRSLLMLEDNFELLSLNSMKIGVQQINVTLYDKPDGCIGALTAKDTVNLIRTTLLNDFKVNQSPSTATSSSDQHVCNMYVKDSDGYALFVYTCCHYYDQELVCVDVEKDSWMSVLMIFVISIKVLLVMFSPLLIPENMYRAKFTAAEYHYHVPDNGEKSVKVVVTRDPESYESDKVVKLNRVEGMEYFQTFLSTRNVDEFYEMKLKDLRLSVSSHRLLRDNSVPVGMFRYFYDNVCRCKLRNTKAFTECCTSSVCGNINLGFKTMAWYKCIQPCMKMMQVICVTLPWIIRVIIFFKYEEEQESYKANMAENLGLKMYFRGSFTIFLSPLHGLFLTCYILLVFDGIFYGVLSQSVKEKFKLVSTTSLRDLREKSKLNVCSWAIDLALAPFKSFGFLGFLLIIPYWVILTPFLVLVFLFYFVPTINFTIRMVIHFFIFLCPQSLARKSRALMAKIKPVNSTTIRSQLGENNFRSRKEFSRKGLLFQYVVIIICIISFWSLIFLVVECVSFFVEMAMYTTIGIIINAKTSIKYISVVSLLILYAKDCFGKFQKKYLTFHKVIVDLLLKKEKEVIDATARSDSDEQENTVFRVPSEEDKETDATLIVKDGEMKWKTSGLLVFLNQYDRPFFTQKFFFQLIEKMKYHGCPGPLHLNIIRAFMEFFKIIIFITFIIIVVMAFGDVYSISSTNQMIATGAGGLLPFAFRHFFAKKVAPIFNVESVQFKAEFNKALSDFQQNWPVFDIIPDKIKKLQSQYTFPANLDDINGHVPDSENLLMTSSTRPLVTDDISVDLIIDISTIKQKDLYRNTYDGSMSMLADNSRDTNYNKLENQNTNQVFQV